MFFLGKYFPIFICYNIPIDLEYYNYKHKI